MFRHRNRGRNYVHNIQLAALLSMVAGVVNIVGVLSISTLTTNVTGHFAFFSEGLFLHNYGLAAVSIIYVFSFLIGAFVANTAMEITSKDEKHYSYMAPLLIEIFLLLVTALVDVNQQHIEFIFACLLLAAMGIQNALVTRISGSVVRTTHLTGLFTDLGIELSQWLIYKKKSDRIRLRKAMLLKAIIIVGFFIGGLAGASLYGFFDRKTLILPVAILFAALYYDRILLQYYKFKRRH